MLMEILNCARLQNNLKAVYLSDHVAFQSSHLRNFFPLPSPCFSPWLVSQLLCYTSQVSTTCPMTSWLLSPACLCLPVTHISGPLTASPNMPNSLLLLCKCLGGYSLLPCCIPWALPSLTLLVSSSASPNSLKFHTLSSILPTASKCSWAKLGPFPSFSFLAHSACPEHVHLTDPSTQEQTENIHTVEEVGT